MSNASSACPTWRLPQRSEQMTTRREFIQVTLTASVGGALAAAAGETLSLQPIQLTRPEYAGAVRNSLGDPARPAPLPLYAALFDRRFSDSRLFSWAAQQRGIEIRSISGDVTDVWYSELHPRWKEAAVPIAGVTTYGPLFCLERLAWDHGMRVVYRGSHQRRPDRTIEHRLETAAPQLGVRANQLEAAAQHSGITTHQLESTAQRPRATEHRLELAKHRLEVAAEQSEAMPRKLSGRDAWPVEIAALMAGISPLAKPVPLNRSGVTTMTCVGQCAPTVSEPSEALYSWVIAPRARA
jgi:hypothetical protein